jgi:hypothetical protein
MAHRSADDAYYRAKQQVKPIETAEGRSNARPHASYFVRPGDGHFSSDKYYASRTVAPVATTLDKRVELVCDDTPILVAVTAAFGDGATAVQVTGDAIQISKAKTGIDLAVGQNRLTRAQADRIQYVVTVSDVVVAAPATAPEPVTAVVEEAPAEEEAPVIEDLPAAEEPVVEEPVQRVAKKGRRQKAAEEITETDVAEAFGVDQGD